MIKSASLQSNPQQLVSNFQWADVFTYGAFVFIIFLGSQLLYSKNLFCKIIPHLPQLNPSVGSVTQLEGDVSDRSQMDVIWFPLLEHNAVYEGDRIMTGPDSKIELLLAGEIKLNLGPDSLIQIRLRSGQLFIDLITGDIKIKNPNRLKVTIRTNDEMTESNQVEILKVTNSSVHFLPESIDLVQSNPASAEKSEPTPVDETIQNTQLKPTMPYPSNGSIILSQSPQKIIRIFAKDACAEKTCSLKIVVNNLAEKNILFKYGDPVVLNYEWVSGQPEKIEWIFISNGKPQQKTFYIESFSLLNFKNAVRRSKQVEIQ